MNTVARPPAAPLEIPEDLFELAQEAERICILTGAGMSAESGVPTFRDPIDGLWENYSPEDLVSVAGWETDPAVVWAWHLWFAALISRCRPNAGHRALGRWQRAGAKLGTTVEIITQNIDDLHERGGAKVGAHLHGEIMELRCSECGAKAHAPLSYPGQPQARITPPRCPFCGGYIRHCVTWFGEELPRRDIDASIDAASSCDLMLVIGTSGNVYPAAGLPHLASGRGVAVVEINPRDTALSHEMDIVWRESAAIALPALVDAALH